MFFKAIRLFRHRRELAPLISKWHFLIENRSQTFWGSLSAEDELAIVELVKKAAHLPGPIVEVGALFGFTTQLIATFKPIDKALVAVEDFSWNPFSILPNDHRVVIQRVLRYCTVHCNTSIFDGSNIDFYATYNGESPSMVFIDADHSYAGVKEDLRWAVNLGIPIISGHDYNALHPEVMQAVDETFRGEIVVRGSIWHHLGRI